MADVVLPTGYYLDNFRRVLEFVEKRHADLLAEPERHFSQTFSAMSQKAQRLYVRLISRKGPHFREDKLHYPEIGDIAAAADELAQAALLAINPDLAPAELLTLLNRDELLEIGRNGATCRALKKLRKAELVAALAQLGEPAVIQTKISRIFRWLTPLQGEALTVYRLLFFGNLGQDLTEFVLLDLGLIRYERYKLSKKDRLFQTREVLLDTLGYYQIREETARALDEGDDLFLQNLPATLPNTHGEASLKRRRNKILNHVGRYFERKGDFPAALHLYAEAEAPPARERRARILARVGAAREALNLCETMLRRPLAEPELVFARRFEVKMRKMLGLSHQPPSLARHPCTTVNIAQQEKHRIEDQVLSYFCGLGRRGFYAENRFWVGLFGLVFWDILFMPVRGAFFNRYQRGPKDLFHEDFRPAREVAIQNRLQQVLAGDWSRLALETFDAKFGIANYLVSWPAMDRSEIESVAAVVPSHHVTAIFDRLSRHPGEFRSGLPDLFLEGGTDWGYELVEVKGPGDQLQPNQRQWLRYLKSCEIPYRIVKVAWNIEYESEP